MGTLYLIPTPVGNLEDITLRALRILKEVDLILAEDTRTSGLLLKHYEINNRLCAHHKFNEHQTAEAFASRIAAGETMALVSDAGTPGISDPGFMLVRACVAKGVRVECLPGATAFVPALVASGLPCERFTFEGFLPQKKGRNTRLQELRTPHDDHLRVALSHRQVVGTIRRSLWRRPQNGGSARDLEKIRGMRAWHYRRSPGTLHRARTKG